MKAVVNSSHVFTGRHCCPGQWPTPLPPIFPCRPVLLSWKCARFSKIGLPTTSGKKTVLPPVSSGTLVASMRHVGTSLMLKDHIGAMPADVDSGHEVSCSHRTQANVTTGTQCALRLSISAQAQTGREFPDALDLLQGEARNMREPRPSLIKVDIEVPPTLTAPKKRAAVHCSEVNETEMKKRARDALHENIMEDFCTPSADTPVTADTNAHADAFATMRAENEELRRKLAAAEERVGRLTDALLGQIEAARTNANMQTCQCKQPAGEVIAEFIVPSLDGAPGLPGEMVGELAAIDPACDEPGTESRMPESTSAEQEGPVAVVDSASTCESKQPEVQAPEADVVPAAECEAGLVDPKTCQANAPVGSSFKVVEGKVQIGAATWMSQDKFAYIMRSTSDAKCVLQLSKHLWLEDEAAERSLTGQAPRAIKGASGKTAATPEKVGIVENFLAKYIEQHPQPGGPLAEHRLKKVRKHLRTFFTEASRKGKRRRTQKIKP